MIDKAKNLLWKDNSPSRRNFLKFAGLGLTTLVMTNPLKPKTAGATAFGDTTNWWQPRQIWSAEDNEWKDVEYFVQPNVDFSNRNIEGDPAGPGTIRAKIDNYWAEYQARELSDEFIQWGGSERWYYYDDYVNGVVHTSMEWGGIHQGMVATYGNRRGRGDSAFHQNVAVKGTALCPKREILEYMIPILREWQLEGGHLDDYMEMQHWVYNDYNNFDKTRMLTLELYTQSYYTPLENYKHTHTFGNIMTNPMTTLCFLVHHDPLPSGFINHYTGEQMDYGNSFEVRAIPRLMHPWAPGMGDDYDQFGHDGNYNFPDPDGIYGYWLNLLHSFYHGGRRNWIAVVYNIVEQFKNTPSDTGRGIRKVPPLP